METKNATYHSFIARAIPKTTLSIEEELSDQFLFAVLYVIKLWSKQNVCWCYDDSDQRKILANTLQLKE